MEEAHRSLATVVALVMLWMEDRGGKVNSVESVMVFLLSTDVFLQWTSMAPSYRLLI